MLTPAALPLMVSPQAQEPVPVWREWRGVRKFYANAEVAGTRHAVIDAADEKTGRRTPTRVEELKLQVDTRRIGQVAIIVRKTFAPAVPDPG